MASETSPLLLSLLAGNNGAGAGITDPAYLAAMPRLNLAQQMMEQSMSAAPAYPMQALARVVSGFVGNRIYDKAMQGLIQTESGIAPKLANNLPDDDPLKKVLLATNDDGSPDVSTRFQGIEAYKQHLLTLGEPRVTRPGETVNFAGGTPNTNPQSTPGKILADAANASSPLAQQLLTSQGINEAAPGDILHTPSGPMALPGAGTVQGQTKGNEAAAAGPGQGQGQAAVINATTQPEANKAAAVAAAENPPLIQRAGGIAQAEVAPRVQQAAGEAAARAPFESGESVRVTVPKGAILPDGSIAAQDTIQEIPITAAERSGLLTRLTGTGSAGAAPQAPRNAAPAAPAPAPQQGAAATAPKPQIIGNLPNDPTVAPRIDADTKEVATDRENAQKVLPDAANLREVQDLMERVGRTGWGANEQMEGGRILKALGASPDTLKEFGALDPSNAQALNKLFTVNSAAAVRNMGAREPGSVIQLFRNAYQNIGTDPDAIKLMTNSQYMNTKWLNDLANAKSDRLTQESQNYQKTGLYKGLQGFNQEFSQTNSPEDYMHAAEAMSGPKYNPWGKIKDPNEQARVYSFIPKGSQYVDGEGNWRTKQ